MRGPQFPLWTLAKRPFNHLRHCGRTALFELRATGGPRVPAIEWWEKCLSPCGVAFGSPRQPPKHYILCWSQVHETCYIITQSSLSLTTSTKTTFLPIDLLTAVIRHLSGSKWNVNKGKSFRWMWMLCKGMKLHKKRFVSLSTTMVLNRSCSSGLNCPHHLFLSLSFQEGWKLQLLKSSEVIMCEPMRFQSVLVMKAGRVYIVLVVFTE